MSVNGTVSGVGQIHGTVSGTAAVKGTVSGTAGIRGRTGGTKILYTDQARGDPYSGAYEITPKVEAQTMATKNKVMLDDVTVKAIPIYEVSNEKGGTTVYIAMEV